MTATIEQPGTMHAYSIHEDAPTLGLQKDDVILIELAADDPVVLYRPISIGYGVLQGLLDRGTASASPSAREVLTAWIAETHPAFTRSCHLALVP